MNRMTSAFARVNGLDVYYEIHGERGADPPILLLHGGDPTIETSFAQLLPELAKHRQVIAFEQAGHGHTADRPDEPFSFEQSADDAAALLASLGIDQADILGYSNGATIALQVAIRHPRVVRKLVVESGTFRRDGVQPWLIEALSHPKLDDMPPEYREAYKRTSPHPDRLQSYLEKSAQRMVEFQDIPDAAIKSIAMPALIVVGDRDVIRPEHTLAMFQLLPDAQLCVLPNTDHGQIVTKGAAIAAIVEAFLDGK